MLVMPVIEKPADTVANASAATSAVTVMPRAPVTVTVGCGWVTARETAAGTFACLRFRLKRRCRSALVGSLALGLNSVIFESAMMRSSVSRCGQGRLAIAVAWRPACILPQAKLTKLHRCEFVLKQAKYFQ